MENNYTTPEAAMEKAKLINDRCRNYLGNYSVSRYYGDKVKIEANAKHPGHPKVGINILLYPKDDTVEVKVFECDTNDSVDKDEYILEIGMMLNLFCGC